MELFRTGAFRCGCSQAARPLISQSAALGLGRPQLQPVGPQLWAWSSAAGGSTTLGLSRAAGRSTALSLCVGQLASAPGAHPPRFQVWVPSWGFRCGWLAGVSVVGPQSAILGVHNRASGESWGCLSRVHSPVAEGGGAPEAAAAVETSLSSR